MVLVYIFIGTLLLLCCGQLVGYFKMRKMQRLGIYPLEPTAATERDIIKLLEQHERIMAIRLYRTIHRTGLANAKAAVDGMIQRLELEPDSRG